MGRYCTCKLTFFAWDCCGQLRGWAGVSAPVRGAAASPARMGSARVLTIHGHTFENEIFLFISQSRGGKSILFYITVLLELRIGSLRLNEFHLRAVAGCSFFFFFFFSPRPPTQSNITFSFRCRFSRLQHLNSRCSCAGIGSFIIGGSLLRFSCMILKTECGERRGKKKKKKKKKKKNTKRLIYMWGSLRFCLRDGDVATLKKC